MSKRKNIILPHYYSNHKDSEWRHIRKLNRLIRAKQSPGSKKIKDRLIPSKKSIIPLYNFLALKDFGTQHSFEIIDDVVVIDVPQKFTLIERPEDGLSFIKQLFNLCMNFRSKQIYFDHQKCEELGVAASTLMDILVMNLEKFHAIYKKKVKFGGRLSKHMVVNEILQTSGLLKHLSVATSEYDMSKIKCLELMKGGSTNSGLSFVSIDTGVAATRVAKYFNECLNTMGVEFSADGMDAVSQIVTEVIANCKEHGGDFHQWFALGHYSTSFSDVPGQFGKCSLVILNFGQSIYEGLLLPSSNQEIITSIKSKSELHIKKGYFSKSVWEEESLFTLYSLQEGISRDLSPEKPGRGVGTMKLIDSFQRFGNTSSGRKARMAIISGGTYIYFDGKYHMQDKRMHNNETRKIIAFNESNDLDTPPDPLYVKKLNNFFPGTIITMDFYLERNYLINYIEETKVKK